MGRLGGGMEDRGAMIDIKVMLPRQQVEAFKAEGIPYGRPRVVKGLIDTGASCSAIDRETAEDMKLVSHGFTFIHTPSTGSDYARRLQYAACLVVGEDQADPLVATLPVIECDFSTRDFKLLVGRDVLRSCTFSYDGPTDTFALEWDRERQYPATVGRQ